MKCQRRYHALCRQDCWSRSISSLQSKAETVQILSGKHVADTLMRSNRRKIRAAVGLWCAVLMAFLLASSSMAEPTASAQNAKPLQAPESHKVISLVKTDRVWEPRRWHLTRKRYYYKVEGREESVMMLSKIKGVKSDIKHKIDIHQFIQTSCTLIVTGLQIYQSGVFKSK